MSNPTTEQLQTWLAEARAAYHELITGTAVVSMSQGGRTLSYNQAQTVKLAQYIRWLEGQLCPNAVRPARRFTMTQTGSGYENDGC